MKNILLIATGGTIASAEDGRGLSPSLTGEELARAVPEIAHLAHIDICQLMNIDSTNMRPADWLRISRAVTERYGAYDGFVILHGTDTMAYTAAALSYLIQDSPKPIILTGSQKPMGDSFTDAKLNLFQSIIYAIDGRSRDVVIVFGGAVIAGTRGRKQRTMSFNAFKSVNYPSIAYIRNDRIVRSGDALVRAQGLSPQPASPARRASSTPSTSASSSSSSPRASTRRSSSCSSRATTPSSSRPSASAASPSTSARARRPPRSSRRSSTGSIRAAPPSSPPRCPRRALTWASTKSGAPTPTIPASSRAMT